MEDEAKERCQVSGTAGHYISHRRLGAGALLPRGARLASNAGPTNAPSNAPVTQLIDLKRARQGESSADGEFPYTTNLEIWQWAVGPILVKVTCTCLPDCMTCRVSSSVAQRNSFVFECPDQSAVTWGISYCALQACIFLTLRVTNSQARASPRHPSLRCAKWLPMG